MYGTWKELALAQFSADNNTALLQSTGFIVVFPSPILALFTREGVHGLVACLLSVGAQVNKYIFAQRNSVSLQCNTSC